MPKKARIGKVIANTSTNTITVLIERQKIHKLYRKQFTVSKKFQVDTAGKTFEIGQSVTIEETRPLSKTKHWVVADK